MKKLLLLVLSYWYYLIGIIISIQNYYSKLLIKTINADIERVKKNGTKIFY
jgi:hypothetical protein